MSDVDYLDGMDGTGGKIDLSIPLDCPNLQLRGSIDNSRLVFDRTGVGNVAFLGGSITERDGYRPLVCAELRKRFPKTTFRFINAGISSTASITGAFRLRDDVLRHGPIDLLFVEFAVNDDQDAHYSRAECIRGLEGILRHLWLKNPDADVVGIHFVNESMLASLRSGVEPLSSGSHEIVLTHYGVPSIGLNREVSFRIEAGSLTWAHYGGVHPAGAGNQLGANMILRLLDKAWAAPLASTVVPVPHALPGPIDPGSYFNGHFVDIEQAHRIDGWNIEIPEWEKIGGSIRPRFAQQKLVCATRPGSELTLVFEGTAIGIYVLAGFDAGIVEASIDGASFQRHDLFVDYSKSLHYPHSIVFAGDLSPRSHKLVLRVSGERNPASEGNVARILNFCVH